MKLNKHYIADLALLGVAFAWGTTFQLVKDALADIDTFPFLTIRFFIAFLLLLPFWKGKWKCHPAAIRAGCYLFCGFALQTLGLLWTTPSKAAFITGLNVILVPFLVAIQERKAPLGSACCGALLAVAGLGLLTLEGNLIPEKGDLLVLGCALFFALQIVAVKEAIKTMEASNLTLIQLGVVCLFSFATWGGYGGSIHWSPVVIWALLITAVFATTLAYLTQSWAQRFTSPDRVALILATEPVFAGIFSYFVGGETFGFQKLLGCALIFAGILSSELLGSRAQEEVSAGEDSVAYEDISQ